MANNYQQFSEMLDLRSEEEENWLRAQLAEVFLLEDNTILSPEDSHSDTGCSLPRFLAEAALSDPHTNPEDNCDAGFEHGFEAPKEQGDGRGLWIYAEESGNPDNAGLLVQKFLQRFDPTGWWTLTWAATCSKPRCGEFSGGALLVTAKEILFADAGSWLEERQTALPLSPKQRR